MNTNFQKIFFDIDNNLIVTKCDNLENFEPMPLSIFYEKYISKKTLNIIDTDYSLSYLTNIIHANETSNIYMFQSNIENQFYQFELVKNNDETHSCFIQSISNLQNYDNYGKIDYLTNIDSRNAFLKKVANDIEINAFQKAAIIMVDLDDFKDINDNFGHLIGDICLKFVAAKLSEIIGEDYVGRYGGDEFIIFIKDPQTKDMDSIIKSLLNIKFTTSDKFEGKIKLNLSLGICYFDYTENLNFNTYIQHADSALYEAKHHGKNTYSIYGIKFNNFEEKTKLFMGHNLILFKDEIKHKRIKRNILIVTTIIFLFLIAFTSSYYYSYKLEQTIDYETKTTMKDVSSQVSLTIEQQFISWFGELNMAAETINYNDIDSSLDKMKTIVNFDDIGLLKTDGNLFLGKTDGSYDMAVDEVSKALVIDKKAYVGKTYMNYSGEYIIFGIPYEVYDEANTLQISGIVGLTKMENFNAYLSSSLYDNSLAIGLVDKKGSTISINSSLDSPFLHYNNILNLFENNLYDYEYEQIKEDIYSGKVFTAKYGIEGINYTIYSSEAVINFSDNNILDNWRLILIVPSNVLNQRLQFVMELVIIIYLVVFVMFSVIITTLAILHSKASIKTQLLTYIDPLTNNINGKRFVIDAGRILSKYNDKKYAIIYFDILHFKFINDTYGVDVGNKIIMEFYNIIDKKLKTNEIVARAFGDRFICLKDFKANEDITAFINEISDDVSNIKLENIIYQIHILAGVYNDINKNSNISICIDKANLALDSISEEYINSYIKFFSDEIMVTNNEHIYLEQNQEKALANDEFVVYYQGKRNINKNRFSGSEALVRWISKEKGVINPGEFIPLFEKNGFIIKLDLYVFETVCKDIKAQLDKGEKPLRVSVNMSGKHFMIDHFFDEYVEIINKYHIPCEYIEFELTESMFMENEVKLSRIIERIHEIGCICSIDDFGSGFSSLNMFKDFDFDIIKLDRKFFYGVKGLNDSTKTIIKTIIDLSHDLNKKVVAEGIETKEQVEFLQSVNCDYIQGYYYSKPKPLCEYLDSIKNYKNTD